MTKLTQAVFDNAPDWAKSADLISSGHGFYRSVTKDKMQVAGLWRSLIHKQDICGYRSQMIEQGYYDHHGKYIPATEFDRTNWQNSAIDRGTHENQN